MSREATPPSDGFEDTSMTDSVFRPVPSSLEAGPSHPSADRQRGADLDRLTSVFQSDPPGFTLAEFEGPYKGRALINRLRHVALLAESNEARIPQPLRQLSLAAARRLAGLVKSRTWDTQLYMRITTLIDALINAPQNLAGGDAMDIEPAVPVAEKASGQSGEENGVPDFEWIEEAQEAERKENARLDVELRGYMSNLIKESIRLTYLAFASLSVKSGSHVNAMKNYSAAREYSTVPQHHLDLGLGVLDTCLAFNQPTSLPGHISKLEAALDRIYPPNSGSAYNRNNHSATTTAGDLRENREKEAKASHVRKSVGAKIRVGKGLVALASGDFDRAGVELGEVGEEGGLGDWEGQVISTADVAVITALCVLATSRRSRIKMVLLDRASFRSSVADGQAWLLDLIRAFVGAQYREVAQILRKAEPMFLLNPFLYPHSSTLINLIHTRSIIQYVEPFSTVRIDSMAHAFDMSREDMLTLVEGLVTDKRMAGKIDRVDRVLNLAVADPRNVLFGDAMRIGRETTAATQAALLRMKMHEAKIVVDPREEEEDEQWQQPGATPVAPTGGSGDGGSRGANGAAGPQAAIGAGLAGDAQAGQGPIAEVSASA